MKNILVAEDDKFYAKVYQSKLTKEGYDVTVVGNGKKALEYLENEKIPDLLLLDLIMPEMDGFDVLKAISENNKLKGINVLVMSNLGSEADIEKAKSLGAKDYVVKSNLSIQELIGKIKESLI